MITNASSGCTVRLRGVDIDGLEFGTDVPAATGGVTGIAAYMISNWKCNVIRLPLSQDRWFFYPISYRNLVDQIVNYCSSQNVYVILDLHWSGTASTASTPPYGAGWGTASAQQPMADANAVTFWSDVAARYANNPAVMFDLYNEPYSVSASVWLNGGSAGSFTTPGMKNLLAAVRNTGAKNICLAGGLAYCNDFSQILPNFALAETTGNGILYDAHIYSNNGNQTINGPGPNGNYAFLVGEFGPCATCGSIAWTQNFISSYLDPNNLSWTAWNMGTTGPPILISDWSYTPTSYHGQYVYNSLTGTANPSCDAALGGPTYTPTPVPTQGSCFMLSDLENGAQTAPYAVNALNGKWFTFRWTTLGSGAAETPTHSYVSCPDTNTACSTILNNTTSVVPGVYSAFVSGGYDLNGTSSPATYSGFGIATELTQGYTNLSWVTNFSFYIKTTVAPVTLRFQASNPLINQQPVTWNGMVFPGGGNGNQYGFNFVVNQANTWILESMPLAGMEFQDWCGGTGACPPTASGGATVTQSAAMTQVLSFQWETQGAPTTLAWYVDNVCLSGSPYPITPTPSVVATTPTYTPTQTPSFTPSPTLTKTPSPTSTKTATSTATNTIANTFTSTPTSSPTATPTFTRTNSPTNTVANTATSTVTNTTTNSPTSSMTATPSSTPSRTATMTPTATATNTLANTGTPTSTPTNSSTKTATSTLTATATNTLANTGTPTSTAANTGTSTATFTATNTATTSPTKTATSTPTHTATATATKTATDTTTITATSSPTSTATKSPTATITSTPTNSGTPTPTATGTIPTATNTPTSTTSFTPTATTTKTPTSSATATLTNSATSTSTATATNTLINTGTPTNTATLTTTSTPSRTATSTATATTTNSATRTTTFTPTATPTNTLVNTATPTSTPSSTPTVVTVAASQGANPPNNSNQLSGAANVPVQQVVMANPSSSTVNMSAVTLTVTGTGNPANITSVTLSANGTPVGTVTFSGTTAVFSFSGTLPASSSVTYTVTANFGSSASGTYAFSATGASGNNGQPTLFSGLPVAGATITVAQATSTPTSTQTITPTFTPTPVTVAASQGANPPNNSNQLAGAANVPVQQVVMANPSSSTVNMSAVTLTVTGTGNPANITSVTLSANGTPVGTATFSGTTAPFSFSGTLPASSSVTYTVTANFGSGASGTYAFSATGASGNNGQAVQFSGLPVSGATVTVAQSTPTATITSTPKPVTTPVVFPNPSGGGPVSVMPPAFTAATADVTVQLFTTAFRKVQEKSYSSMPYGPVQVLMQDDWGSPLASGIYYVVITVDGHQRSVAKLLLLR